MIGRGGGEPYFTSKSFGIIDIAPWQACGSAGDAGEGAAKGSGASYKLQGALQAESSRRLLGSYVGLDYWRNDGALRVMQEKSVLKEGAQEGFSEYIGQESSTANISSTCSSSSSTSEGVDDIYIPAAHASSFSAWVDLDSPESFLHLQDIDDSWLDSLPPLNNSCLSPHAGSPPASSTIFAASPSRTSPSENPNPIYPFPALACHDIPLSATNTAPAPPTSHHIHSSSSLAPDRKRLKRLDLSEPKYVVLTRNYESVLKDGFKWRKYGQKSVKNNLYPRSYYKCSYEGCYVHKHVERVGLDPCLILTTYRGRHTH